MFTRGALIPFVDFSWLHGSVSIRCPDLVEQWGPDAPSLIPLSVLSLTLELIVIQSNCYLTTNFTRE